MTNVRTQNLNILGDFACALALRGAEAGVLEIHRSLLSALNEDDDGDAGVLVQDPDHAGAPARKIDARAQDAVTNALVRGFDELRETKEYASLLPGYLDPGKSSLRIIGEESGTPTQILRGTLFVARTDPLDGSTNAENTLTGFCSVVTVDLIRDGHAPRHLAGAVLGGDFDLCWRNDSTRSRTDSNVYARLEGAVFVRSNRLGRDWQQLKVEQEVKTNSVASVAANLRRFTAFETVRHRIFHKDGIVYHTAGNPMWAGLLLGQLGCVVETQAVTLHDSVFLIPHMLLGGHVENARGESLDYIKLYEENATSFDPKSKLVPPYVAYCAGINPLTALADVDLSTTEPPAPAAQGNVPPAESTIGRHIELPEDIF